jgi:hypothetical protein
MKEVSVRGIDAGRFFVAHVESDYALKTIFQQNGKLVFPKLTPCPLSSDFFGLSFFSRIVRSNRRMSDGAISCWTLTRRRRGFSSGAKKLYKTAPSE